MSGDRPGGSSRPAGVVGSREREAEALASLSRVVLDVRLVVLLLVLLTLGDRTTAALGVVVLMAGTSVLPVLAWRRIGGWVLRHPSALSVDLGVAVVLLTTGTVGGPFPLFAVTTAVLAGVFYGRRGGLALSAPLVVAYVLGLLARQVPLDSTSGVVVPLLLVSGAWIGAALRQVVLERQEAVERARDGLVRAATAEERGRLARELHDSVAKTLQGLAMSAAALPKLAQQDPDRATREAERIQQAAARATDEARELLSDLRADDLEMPLAASMEDMVVSWAEAEPLEVELDLDEPEREPAPRVRYELFQILGELLRNIGSHAEASRVGVSLAADTDGLRLAVSDDGRGFEVPGNLDDLTRTGHYGLVGLKERAEAVGGRLTVEAAPGEGTQVEVAVPAGREQEVSS